MRSRGSNNRLSNTGGSGFHSRISALVLTMFATMAAIYVAGRIWQDAESRVYLIQELDRRTGQGNFAVSVDDTLKVIACREQQKKLSALEMDIAAARQEGFVSKVHLENDGARSKKRLLAVIGIITTFGRKKNRDAIRKAWMQSGVALKKLEEEKGIVVRFVIGRSANRGDSLDREIDNEHSQTNDFIVLVVPGAMVKCLLAIRLVTGSNLSNSLSVQNWGRLHIRSLLIVEALCIEAHGGT